MEKEKPISPKESAKRLLCAVLFTAGVVSLTSCGRPPQPENEAQSFESTLGIHLNAIESSNLEKLIPTIADSVVMISPDGDKMDSKTVFVKFHENWFKQKNWLWEYKVLRTESSDSLGYALIRYKFTQKDSTGSVLFQDTDYLTLIFRNSSNGWQLVHDQNTRIPSPGK